MREDAKRKWFYGKDACKRATKEAKIRTKNSGKEYIVEKTLGGGCWVGTREQEKKMHW